MKTLGVDYAKYDGVLGICISSMDNDGVINIEHTEIIEGIFSEEDVIEKCKDIYNKFNCDDFISEDLNFKTGLMTEIPIEFLDLSVIQYRCLKREGINTDKELSKYTKEDLLKVRNLSKWNV